MDSKDRTPPSPDAYSRVTNAERFRPLHAAALHRAKELEREYLVRIEEGSDLDDLLQDVGLERPSVRLVPTWDEAASLQIAFTRFPGIAVGFGIYSSELFPACGCDACAERVDDEIERFRDLIDDVTAGRFRESLVANDSDKIQCRWELWSDVRQSSGGPKIRRGLELRPRTPRRWKWAPWPTRNGRSTWVDLPGGKA